MQLTSFASANAQLLSMSLLSTWIARGPLKDGFVLGDEDGGKTKAIVLSTLRSRAEGGISDVAAMPIDVGPIRMGRMSSKGAGGFLDAAATIEPGKSHDNAVTKHKSENLATCRE